MFLALILTQPVVDRTEGYLTATSLTSFVHDFQVPSMWLSLKLLSVHDLQMPSMWLPLTSLSAPDWVELCTCEISVKEKAAFNLCRIQQAHRGACTAILTKPVIKLTGMTVEYGASPSQPQATKSAQPLC